MMNATTRKGMIKAASQRVSGKMRSSGAKLDGLKKARRLLLSFMVNLLLIGRATGKVLARAVGALEKSQDVMITLLIGKSLPISHCYLGFFELHHGSSFLAVAQRFIVGMCQHADQFPLAGHGYLLGAVL